MVGGTRFHREIHERALVGDARKRKDSGRRKNELAKLAHSSRLLKKSGEDDTARKFRAL